MLRNFLYFGFRTLNANFRRGRFCQYHHTLYKVTGMRNYHKLFPICEKNTRFIQISLGFSILTLLGFDKKETDEDVIILNIKRSILLIQKKEYPKAEQMLHLALRMAQQTLNDRAVTYIYDVMANLAMEVGQFEKAEKLFTTVMKRLLSDGIQEHDAKNIHISLKLARIYYLKGDLEKAEIGFKWCLDGLKKYQQDDDDILLLLGLTNDWYGHLLFSKSLYAEAIVSLTEAFETLYKFKDDNLDQIILLLNDIAASHEKLEEYDKAETTLKNAIQLGRDTPTMETLGPVHVNLGRIYFKKGLYVMSRKTCGFAFRVGKDNNDKDTMKEAKECVKEAIRHE